MKTRLEISESGKLLKIFHENGRLISEMLVHGGLVNVMENCDAQLPIVSGRPNVFRAEVYGLAGWEYLNTEKEQIEERW